MSACSFDSFDMRGADPERFSMTRWPRARRAWYCCECSELIPRGARYEMVTGRWRDGGWQTYRTCSPCCAIRNQLAGPAGFLRGELRQHLWECLGVDYVTGEIDPSWKDRGE